MKKLFLSFLSFVLVFLSCPIVNVEAASDSNNPYEYSGIDKTRVIDVVTPSTVSIVFNEDGTNTISAFNITNNSTLPIRVTKISVASLATSPFQLVNWNSDIAVNETKIAMQIEGKDVSVESTYDFEIKQGASKVLDIQIQHAPIFNRHILKTQSFKIDVEYEEIVPTLMYSSSNFNAFIKAKNLTTFTATDKVAPADAELTDLSVAQNGGVVYWDDGTNGYLSTQVEGVKIETLATMSYMFNSCSTMTNINLLGLETKNITSMSGMFNSCKTLTHLYVSNWNTSNVTGVDRMFSSCSSLNSLDVSNWNTGNVTNMSCMFSNCSSLNSLDVSKWDTEKVTDMDSMFLQCYVLNYLDVSNWNTGNVINMDSTFDNTNLSSLNVSNWDTKNVTNMRYMFVGYDGTTLDVSKWDVGKVESMNNMFRGCNFLESLDVSKWNTSNVIDMRGTFNMCSSLNSLNISNWNTGNVTNMETMFSRCSSLTSLDVSKWNTEKVTNMDSMFHRCSSLNSLDISNWNTGNVANMSNMFSVCLSLSGELVFDVNKLSKVTNYSQMFTNCSINADANLIIKPARASGITEDIIDKMMATKTSSHVTRATE